MKPLLILAAALACAAAPASASAQTAAPQNEDGTHYCGSAEVTLRELPEGGYAVNYTQALAGDPDAINYDVAASSGLFDPATPVIDLFYSGRWDESAGAIDYFSASSITGTFGTYADGRMLAPDGVRVVIESGSLKSPPLILTTAARADDYVSGAMVAPLNAIDANDVEASWDEVGMLAEALVKRGGTIILTDANGRVLATAQIPPSEPEAGRPAAIAYALKTLPYLKQGTCPD